MIRQTIAEDVPTLIRIAEGTGVFKAAEIVVLNEVLGDYLKKPRGEGYHFHTFERDGEVQGFSCHGPNTMTDRTWDLYWIAVQSDRHSQGIGSELLRELEEDVRRNNGRLIVVETSSLPSYELTRRFYRKHGYEESAMVRDFYADGDSLIFFSKRL